MRDLRDCIAQRAQIEPRTMYGWDYPWNWSTTPATAPPAPPTAPPPTTPGGKSQAECQEACKDSWNPLCVQGCNTGNSLDKGMKSLAILIGVTEVGIGIIALSALAGTAYVVTNKNAGESFRASLPKFG